MIAWFAVAAALAAPPELEGTWALEMLAVTAAKVPVIGEVRSESRTWVHLRMTQDDATVTQEHRVCGAEVKGGLVKTRLSDRYVAAVPTKTYTATLAAAGDRWTYEADVPPFRMGYDPSCAAVPSEGSDPCVVDSDGDGHPGATIDAKAPMFGWVSVYVAQRTHPLLRGSVADGEITGPLVMRDMTNHVLGASNRLFASSPQARLIPSDSVFRIVRLAPGATCADVLARFGD